MVGSDRLNVPAIDTFRDQSSSSAMCTIDMCPLLGWGAPLSMARAQWAVSAVGQACTGSPPAAAQEGYPGPVGPERVRRTVAARCSAKATHGLAEADPQSLRACSNSYL